MQFVIVGFPIAEEEVQSRVKWESLCSSENKYRKLWCESCCIVAADVYCFV